jgi:GTP cyclohydrolase II
MADRPTVNLIVKSRIPSEWGEFQLALYENDQDNKEHLAYIFGDVADQEDVLTRVHSECFTGDVLGSRRCDCGEQLFHSTKMIAEAGHGVLIYMRQEGRGIGLREKLRAYNLQDKGYDTIDANLILGHQADSRDYSIAAAMILDLGIHSIKLITNNPLKIDDLQGHGVMVSDRVSLTPTVLPDNERYLRTKLNRMNHLIELPPDPSES